MTAQKVEKVRVEGTVVKLERSAGEFAGNDGAPVRYDFTEAKVLTDEMDINIVRFPTAGAVPLPEKGTVVVIDCDARAAGGNIKLTAERVRVLATA